MLALDSSSIRSGATQAVIAIKAATETALNKWVVIKYSPVLWTEHHLVQGLGLPIALHGTAQAEAR